MGIKGGGVLFFVTCPTSLMCCIGWEEIIEGSKKSDVR